MSSIGDAWRRIPISRRKQLILVLVALVIIGLAVWTARTVLIPYIFGLVLAYVLAPLVRFFERGFLWLSRRRHLRFLRRAARGLAIGLVYLLVLATLVGFFSVFVPMLIDQGKALWAARDTIWRYIYRLGENVVEQYRLLPEQVRVQIDENITKFGAQVGKIIQQAVGGTAVVISYTFSLLLAILIIPFWTFYMLLDSRKLSQTFVRSIPASIREDVLKIAALVDAVFASYLRGQLLLALIIGSVSTIFFGIAGVQFALILGVIAGLFELIPNIGPILGAIPAILVALAQDPTLALVTTIYAVVIQQIENIFITPRVLGRSVQLHPVLVMVVLVIGSELGGLVGLFLAPVVTAVLRDLFRYIYYRLEETPLSPAEALAKVWSAETFDIQV
ncbi:MAG TPA: AI-2E family transporter [Anaerolineae bacterium]|nr:AI-2E family transporter [Anaerolineae bacterium]HQK14034.1 AI-2E family transporter [Anaerolineae bacterium]